MVTGRAIPFEAQRKRRFFGLLVLIGIPVVLIFAGLDYLEEDYIELVIDGVIGATILASLFAIWRLNADRVVYLFGLNLINAAMLYNVSIGAGEESALYWILITPLLLYFFLERRDASVSMAGVTLVLLVLIFLPQTVAGYHYGTVQSVRFLVIFAFVIIMAYGLESSQRHFHALLKREHDKLVNEKNQLVKALEDIETLSGLLPICSQCKKIRDDAGYWHQVESYIKDRSRADFSHSICPDCARDLYPDIVARGQLNLR